MSNVIQQIQDFSRFYAAMFGGQDGSTLPDGLSATEGRILGELMRQDGLTARGIMKTLGLDAGYLSRILAGFEKKKLIRREQSRRDKRAMLLHLTPRGRALAEQLDAQYQAHIRQQLAGMDGDAQEALVRAMRDVRTQCTPERRAAPLVIRQLKLGDAGWIIHRHGALIAVEQGWDERFEGMCAGILADFIRQYDARFERSWVAERNGHILGSLFLVREDEQTAKLRLLYTEKEARGMGLATKLIEKSIQFARQKHYQRVRLFTTSENIAARRIYERIGFVKISEESTDVFCKGLMGEIWELAL